MHCSTTVTCKKPIRFEKHFVFIFFAVKRCEKMKKMKKYDNQLISIHESPFMLFQTCFPTLRNPGNPNSQVLWFILAPKTRDLHDFCSFSGISSLFDLLINRAISKSLISSKISKIAAGGRGFQVSCPDLSQILNLIELFHYFFLIEFITYSSWLFVSANTKHILNLLFEWSGRILISHKKLYQLAGDK